MRLMRLRRLEIQLECHSVKFPFVTNAIAEILGGVDMNDTLDDE